MFEKTKHAFGRFNDAALMCFAVSAGAFVAAGIGAIVNHMLAGWMAVGGMAMVGLFYLALGLFSLGSPADRDASSSPAAAGEEEEAAVDGAAAASRSAPPPPAAVNPLNLAAATDATVVSPRPVSDPGVPPPRTNDDRLWRPATRT